MNKELSYLTSLFGASGSESDVRQAILNEIRPYCKNIEVDALGNIIAFKQGAEPAPCPIMLCAHMDEVALMVTEIDKSGYLHFDSVGGIDPRILPGTHVVIGKKKYHGVIGVLAPHFEKSGEEKVPKMEDLYVDFGAKDQEDAQKYVSVGDLIGFETAYREFGEDLVRAKALDDRAGCHILLNLIKKELPFDAYFVFSVMEEIGCVGAQTAAFSILPQYALILEGTTAGDIHTDDSKSPVCRLGEGPVVSFMDRSAIYDRELFALVMQSAKEQGIPVQVKQAVAGGNESGPIQRALNGCRVIALSVPCRYIHCPVSIANLKDIENTEKLAEAVLKKLF